MELSTLYWILILPNIGVFFTVIGVLIIVACLFLIISAAISIDCTYGNEDKINRLRKTRDKATKFMVLPVIILFIAVFIPSGKQMMYMIGGYAATNIEDVEKLPKNVVNAANKFLESYAIDEEAKKQ